MFLSTLLGLALSNSTSWGIRSAVGVGLCLATAGSSSHSSSASSSTNTSMAAFILNTELNAEAIEYYRRKYNLD